MATVPAPRATAQGTPRPSVFQVVVWGEIGHHFYLFTGTGFFIAADGTALTASHVVQLARKDPAWHINAVIGKEIYYTSIICASQLSRDDGGDTVQGDDSKFSRDVAEIRVTAIGDGFLPGLTYATEHRGPLPQFPFLRMANPEEGQDVSVFGFGRLSTAPVPYAWSASGAVERLFTFHDGTPGVQVRYTTPPQPGHSGSPVLNARGEVIGMLDWLSRKDPYLGVAVSSAALDPPCP